MAKLSILAGATSQSVNVFIQDSSSTVGAGLSGLVFNTSGLIGYYTFAGTNAGSVQITLATLAAVNSAYSSGGFKEIDATNMKGLYRLDLPNAAIASAKGRVVTVMLSGATNMAPLALEIELTGWDNQDGVRGGMTALPNAAANAAGGLPVSIAGALDLDEMNVDIEAIQTSLGTPLTAAQIATGVWTDTTAGDFTTALSVGKSVMNGVALGTGLTINGYTGNTPQTGDCFARLGAPAGASIAADLAEIEGETDAIGTSTAGLTFTVANQVDVNVVDWKGAAAPAMTGDAFARLGAPVGASISADIAEVEGETDAIIATLGTPAGASVSADIAALNNISTAQVKTQVVAALNTDTYAEPGQGTPAATATLAAKINYLFKAWRNKTTQTASTYSLFNDGGTTVDQKAAVSDDGTTFTRGQSATGP